MTRNQAIASMDNAIANATGAAIEILKAHKHRMVQGWAQEDAKLEKQIAAHKARTLKWQKSIDFTPY